MCYLCSPYKEKHYNPGAYTHTHISSHAYIQLDMHTLYGGGLTKCSNNASNYTVSIGKGKNVEISIQDENKYHVLYLVWDLK